MFSNAGAGRVTAQISTQLPVSRSPSVTGSAVPVGTPSDEFCQYQPVQTTGGNPC